VVGYGGGCTNNATNILMNGVVGTAIAYCITVENMGNTYFTNIRVIDKELKFKVGPIALHSPGATLRYVIPSTITGNLINTARVTGKPCDANGAFLIGVPDASKTSSSEVRI
jgi:uncharacterized repeat protein (TIGR01451 family)